MKIPDINKPKTIKRTVINTIWAESIPDLEEKIKKEFNRDLKQVRYVKQSDPFKGKNKPCPCGSGKLFKRCCVGKKFGANYLVYVDQEILKSELEREQLQQKEISKQHEREVRNQADRLREVVGPQNSMENQIQDNCPICGMPAEFWTKSPWKDRLCRNKHVWHTCSVHNKTVIGPPNYTAFADDCSCRSL